MRYRRSPRIAVLAVLWSVCLAGEAFAHPHVFITCHVQVYFDDAGLSKLSFEWTFDELFSQMIIADYDNGGKGYFTGAEAAALKKGAFDNLVNYHYFVALGLDGKVVKLPPIRDFKPSIAGGRLVYAFSLPLSVPLAGQPRKVTVTIYDDTYYVAFDKMSVADVDVQAKPSVECAVSIEKTKVRATWPGQFMPDMVVLRLK
jgi:ABC-type uncharacterized transport system substrate-binding protein